jgi:hypothetical protein
MFLRYSIFGLNLKQEGMSVKKTELTGIKFIDKIFYDHDINRYGITSLLLLIIGCTGGIAVGLGGLNSTVQLSFLVVVTMAALSMMLAVAPMKYIVYTSIFAVIVDVIVLLINYFKS